MPSRAGNFVANVLGIKLQNPEPYEDELLRGESVLSADTFVEEPPHTAEYLRGLLPSGKELQEYVLSLFPFLSWIGHYNLQWLMGDLVAGEAPILEETRPR